MSGLEVKGRGDHWTVSYPNEERLASPFPVYDKEGVYKHTIHCGSVNGQEMTERSFAGTEREAVEYASWLLPGVEVKVTRTLTKAEALERAREARR
jgi:hypothetical protein